MKTITGLTRPLRPVTVRADPRQGQHSSATRWLHWSSAAAVLLAVAAVLAREVVESPAPRAWLMDLHRQAGLFVLLGLGLRLAVRLGGGLIDLSVDAPRWVRWAAVGAHLALYAVLLGLPLLGWAASNAHGVTLRLFGVLPLPSLVDDDPDLADTLTDWHSWVAWGFGALVALHVAAALWHHQVRHDGVLLAMLPRLQRRGR